MKTAGQEGIGAAVNVVVVVVVVDKDILVIPVSAAASAAGMVVKVMFDAVVDFLGTCEFAPMAMAVVLA